MCECDSKRVQVNVGKTLDTLTPHGAVYVSVFIFIFCVFAFVAPVVGLK